MSNFNFEIKTLAKQSLIYGISSAIGRLLSLISAPILTRIFSPSDYGMISLVQIALGLAILFAGLNIGSGVMFYYFHYDDHKIKKNILSSGLVTIISLGFLIASLLYIFADHFNSVLNFKINNEEKINVVQFLKIGSFSVFFGIIMTSMQSILRIKQEPKKYAIVEFICLISSFVLTLVFVITLNLGIKGVFLATVFGSLLGMLTAIYFCRNYFGKVISLTLLLPIFTYALPQVPSVLINWIQNQVGRIFINYYLTLSDQGLYAIAFIIATLMMMVTTAFRTSVDPYALSIMKRKNAKEIYSKIYSGYAFIFGILLAFISCFTKPALMILTPPEYHSAYHIVIWLLAGSFLMGANNILGVGIWITKKTKYTSYAQLITFVAVVIFSFIFVPYYGAVGAAVAFFFGSIAQSLSYFLFAQNLYYINFQYLRVKLKLSLLIIVCFLNNLLIKEQGFLNSTLIGFISFSISTFIVFVFITNEDQRSWMVSGATKYIKRLKALLN